MSSDKDKSISIKNGAIVALSLYIGVFVGLAYVTEFIKTDLKGIVIGKERGDDATFKKSIISNFSDLYRCSPVIGDTSDIGKIRGSLWMLVFSQLLSFIALLLIISNASIATNLKIALGVGLFVLYLVTGVPIWIIMERMTSDKVLRFTDNSRDYECIQFKRKENIKTVLDLIYMSWGASVLQVIGIALYSLFS